MEEKRSIYEAVFDNHEEINNAINNAAIAFSAIEIMTTSLFRAGFDKNEQEKMLLGLRFIAEKSGEEMAKMCGNFRLGNKTGEVFG